MELIAAIQGLSALKEPCEVTIVSDSQYLIDHMRSGRVKKWALKQWYTSNGPVKNQDLWKRILKLTEKHSVSFIKVEGHSGHPWNERCDQLAKAAIPITSEVPSDPVDEVAYFESMISSLIASSPEESPPSWRK